jgi:hypothetical protein
MSTQEAVDSTLQRAGSVHAGVREGTRMGIGIVHACGWELYPPCVRHCTREGWGIYKPGCENCTEREVWTVPTGGLVSVHTGVWGLTHREGGGCTHRGGLYPLGCGTALAGGVGTKPSRFLGTVHTGGYLPTWIWERYTPGCGMCPPCGCGL